MSHPKKSLKSLGMLLLAVAFLAAGCSTSKPGRAKPWNVNITKTTPASIEVDLIGVTPSERRDYESLDFASYWKPDSKVRKDIKPDAISVTLQKGTQLAISKDSSKWTDWIGRGSQDLMVLVNLPGQPLSPGFWRQFLPLDKKSWNAENDTLEIEVRDTRMMVLTPQKTR